MKHGPKLELQYCKVISLQLIKINENKTKKTKEPILKRQCYNKILLEKCISNKQVERT